MGRVEFRRPCPPLRAPRTSLHGGQEGRAGGDEVSPVLALPCCRRGGSVDWDGDAAGGASATGSEGGEAPSAGPPAACGGGGRARSMSATVLVALGGGRRRSRGGDRRRGGARLLRADEMRPNTSGSDAGGRPAGGGEGGESGRACDAGRARPSQEDNAAAPARWASGTSTWGPGATRGGATGQLEPPEEPVWPTWPAH